MNLQKTDLRTRGKLSVGKEKDPRKKAGHMALRNNVQDLKLDLWHEVKPLEYYLIEIIIDKTIKWRTKEARIKIQELMERTRQADTHIYAALRELKRKNIITWKKDRMGSIIGLNEEYFGGLLIKRHEDALLERRKKIRVVVDNSENHVDNSKSTDGYRQSDRRQTSVKVTTDVSQNDEIRQSNQYQDTETIDEMRSLNTLLKDISLNTSLLKESAAVTAQTGNGESFTLSGEQGTENLTPEQVEKIKKQQLEAWLEAEKKQA